MNYLRKHKTASKICLFILIMSFSLSVVGCAAGWKGYENANLSKYLKLGDYKNLEYELKNVEVTEDEIDEEIESILQSHSEKKSITDRAAKSGDYVTVGYTVSVDGKVVEEFTVKETTFKIGTEEAAEHMKGMYNTLVGLNPGETAEFKTTYPEDYSHPIHKDMDIAGKEAIFTLTLKDLFTMSVPKLTDSFASKISNGDYPTVESYRKAVKDSIRLVKDNIATAEVIDSVWERVIENSEVIMYPEEELKIVENTHREMYELYAKSYNMSLEEFLSKAYKMTLEDFEAGIKDTAEKTVKEFLVMYSIAKKENISVTPEEYSSGLADMVAQSSEFSSAAEFEEYYGVKAIESSILLDKVKTFCAIEGKNTADTTENKTL